MESLSGLKTYDDFVKFTRKNKGIVDSSSSGFKKHYYSSFHLTVTVGSVGVYTNDSGALHNLYGPALISRSGEASYFLNGEPVGIEVWQKDVHVINANIESSIDEVLDEKM